MKEKLRSNPAIRRVYFALRTWWPFWFYVLNAPNRQFLMEHPPELDAVSERVANELQHAGIAQSSLDEFFPDAKEFLAAAQAYAQNAGTGESINKKIFLQHLWNPEQFTITKDNPFSRFTTDPRFVGIAATYFGLAPRLRYMTLGRSVPLEEAPRDSQRWHRDPEEKRMCKVFLYLTDVADENGPFEYIPESPYGMTYGNQFPQEAPAGVYPPGEKLEAAFPPSMRKRFTGKAGTLLFCDTTGLHRGGYCTKGERVMFTQFYAAPTLRLPDPWVTIADDVKASSPSPLSQESFKRP